MKTPQFPPARGTARTDVPTPAAPRRPHPQVHWRAAIPAALLSIAPLAASAGGVLVGPFVPETGHWTVVPDGGFEVGDMGGWGLIAERGQFGATTAEAAVGRYSAIGQAYAQFDGYGFAAATEAATKPGHTYVLSGFVKAPTARRGTNFYIDLNDIPGEVNIGPDYGIAEWQFVWAETPPLEANSVVVRLVVDGTVGVDDVAYFDEIALTPSDEFQPPTVQPPAAPPVITHNPSSQVVCPDSDVTLTVTAEGDAPLCYQWQQDGMDLAGETNQVLELDRVTTHNSGDYVVVVSNPFGSATSAPPARLEVSATVRLGMPRIADTGLWLPLPTVSGWSYTVQYTDTLTPPAWRTLTHLLGAGRWIELLDPLPSPATRFYRAALGLDTDHDGLTDAEEVHIHETDPNVADSDQDELSDGDEIEVHGTDPLCADTDGDGLTDGQEVNGNTSPTLEDTDADGVRDAAEVETGTDPARPDSDDDGLTDGEEMRAGTDPHRPDTDGDGLRDGQEAGRGAWWVEGEALAAPEEVVDDPEAVGGKAMGPGAAPQGGLFFDAQPFGPLPAGTYKLMLRARCAICWSGNPTLLIGFEGGDRTIIETHPLPCFKAELVANPQLPVGLPSEYAPLVLSFQPNQPPPPPRSSYQWFSTPDFTLPDGFDLFVHVQGTPGDKILIDRFLLLATEGAHRVATDPLQADTDGDGLSDGGEGALDSYWYEAEHYAPDPTQLRHSPDMSNGQHVGREAAGARLCVISNATVYPSGAYQLYLRAGRALETPSDLSLTFTVETAGTLVSGSMPLTALYEWNLAKLDDGSTAFNVPAAGTATITVSQSRTGVDDVAYLDKVLVKRLALHESGFAPATSLEVYWSQFRLPEETVLYAPFPVFHVYAMGQDQMWFKSRQPDLEALGPDIVQYLGMREELARPVTVNVPRMTDPMDPDTDHDGYRLADGALPGSMGPLTDARETTVGMNPFDVDTDDDKIPDAIDYNPLTDDTDTDGLLDGQEDTVEPFGLFDITSDLDYTAFLDTDTDHDGISDGNEDRNLNGRRDPGETDPNNPDTDGDGVPDGVEAATGTNPLSADSDGDALLDGQEDTNRNGQVNDGETDPRKPDTDGDGLDDGADPNPLVPDFPDLAVVAADIRLGPQPFAPGARIAVSATIRNLGAAPLENQFVYVGFYDGDPDNKGKAIAWGTILNLKAGAGSSIEPKFDGPANLWWAEPGLHHVYVKVLTQQNDPQPPGRTPGARVSEAGYANNKAGTDVRVLGLPTAFAGPDQGTASTLYEDETVSFPGSGTDLDGSIALYEWDFDSNGVYDWSSASSGAATHAYSKHGCYFARLRVTDDTGYTATDQAMIRITPKGRDSDGDGLPDLREAEIGTDPNSPDTDADGLSDGDEFTVAQQFGLSALDDPDTDGHDNLHDPDSDNDGLLDGDEVHLAETKNGRAWAGTSPYDPDTDGDGMSDFEETERVLSSPLDPDTDSDGLNDHDEYLIHRTRPDDPDTDADGLSDGIDFEPRSRPAAFPWSDQFPKGMIRFDQDYIACGLDGRSEIWKWEREGLGGHPRFDHSAGDKGTRTSDITAATVKDTINEYWASTDFVAHAAAFDQHGWSDFCSWVVTPDGWHPTGYKIFYTLNQDGYRVSFKNRWVATSPDPSDRPFRFFCQKISIATGTRQSVLFQYRHTSGDRYSFTDDSSYTLPGFAYSLYRSDNFDDDTNLPVFGNLALAVPITDNCYQVELRIPAEQATRDSLFLHVMPVWLTKLGDRAVHREALDPATLKMCALVRKVQLAPGKEMTLGCSGLTALADAIPAASAFANPVVEKVTASYTVEKRKEDGQAGAYVVSFAETTDQFLQAGTVLSWLSVVKSATGTVATLAGLVDFENELGDLADTRYGKAMDAMQAASIGTILATDGTEAVLAYKDGDWIKGSLYTSKGGFGILKEVSTLEKIGGEKGKLKFLNNAKGQAALTIAVGAIEVGISVYESTQTKDDIVKLRCYETAGAAAVDTGISLIPFYGQIIEGAWSGSMLVYSQFITSQWVKDVCSSPGSAITFLFEYFAATEIPSGIAEEAFDHCANAACDYTQGLNDQNIPSVFIQPK